MTKRLIAFIVVALLAATASALTLDPLAGWATGEDLDKALEAAKKNQCPIVLLHAPQEGGPEVVMARVYMRLPGLDGMVKVLVYDARRMPSVFQKVASQVEAPSEGLPVLYIASPDLKILGFVEKGGHKKTGGRVGDIAWATWAWVKKARADLQAAEKGMLNGKFGAAQKTFRRVMDEEKERVVQVTKTWNVILTKEEATPLYFPELSGKLDAVAGAASSYVDKAREAYDKKDYDGAKKLLVPMVSDKCDLDAYKQAADLLAKVDEAMKAK